MFKAVVPDPNEQGIILVRGVPFGSLREKDVHGQFFTQRTNFLSHILPLPPVFHFHGAKTGSLTQEVGQTLSREQKDDGVWYKVKLFLDSALDDVKQKAIQLWEAAKAGNLFASSGAVEATIKIAETGEIMQWLVGELSLLDTQSPRENPASFHATAVPFKGDLQSVEVGDVTLDTLNIQSEKSEEGDADAVPSTVMDTVLSFAENLYRTIRPGTASDTGLREILLNDYRTSFGVEPNPTIRREVKMANENEDALARLQQQVAELTAQLATIPQLQTQVTTLTNEVQSRDAQITELRSVVSTKSAEVAMSSHAGLVDGWIKEGKITPAERESVLEVLSFAYQADTTTKGDVGFVNSIKGWVEARPINPAVGDPSTIYTNAGSLNGGVTQGAGGGIDPKNTARLMRYAEVVPE